MTNNKKQLKEQETELLQILKRKEDSKKLRRRIEHHNVKNLGDIGEYYI